MRRVSGYVTDSGKFFEDEETAFDHDRGEKLRKLLGEFVNTTTQNEEAAKMSTRPEALDMFIGMFRDFSFKYEPSVRAG